MSEGRQQINIVLTKYTDNYAHLRHRQIDP